MNAIDRLLQRWRARQAAAWLRAGDRVLDIGCADSSLLGLAPGIGSYLGLDPDCDTQVLGPTARTMRASFPADLGAGAEFDAIVMLAVLEHVPVSQQPAFASACAAVLRPGGRVILSVPSPSVDHILHVLIALHIAHGMREEQHFGFDIRQTGPLFEAAGLTLRKHVRFQLGLNNLFVFEKPGAGQ